MKNLTTLILSYSLLLISCSQTNSKHTASRHKTDSARHTDSYTNDNEDTTHYDEAYPADSTVGARMLTTGYFHNDEVDSNASRQTWIGLFKNGAGYYLAPTTVTTHLFYDEIVDEDSLTPTGWQVGTTSADSALFVIEPLPNLAPHNIEEAHPGKTTLAPGDSCHFSFQGKKYTIFATAYRRMPGQSQTDTLYFNYKLFLSATKNGKTISTLLLATYWYYPDCSYIYFAGDIDGDHNLDLFIETGSENEMKPALYLSQPANEDELVKLIAEHLSVGC